MIIPDYIEPITAYRVWQWDAVGLKSLNHTLWLPGQPFEASCPVYHCDSAGYISCKNVPGDGCSCGVYAARNLKHLVTIGYADHGICGEVSLWGKVVIHKFGYRAEFAYPKSFVIPASFIPTPLASMESRIETLVSYGVPMQIIADGGRRDVLWSRVTGYNPETIDWLVERANKSPMLNRVLAIGDRIAVPMKGIGIVHTIEDDAVSLVMFGREIVTVGRQTIKWDDHNWRWESAGHISVRVIPTPSCPS